MDWEHLMWRLLVPAYWFQNYPTCPAWSENLSEALDRVEVDGAEFRKMSFERHMIDGVEVWTENYPYAFGLLESNGFPFSSRRLPTIPIRRRLRRMVTELSQ